jgi:hypothetical protein
VALASICRHIKLHTGLQALNPTMDDWRKRLSWMSRRLDAVKAKTPAQLPPSSLPENQVNMSLQQT